jgi:hypothetical protein
MVRQRGRTISEMRGTPAWTKVKAPASQVSSLPWLSTSTFQTHLSRGDFSPPCPSYTPGDGLQARTSVPASPSTLPGSMLPMSLAHSCCCFSPAQTSFQVLQLPEATKAPTAPYPDIAPGQASPSLRRAPGKAEPTMLSQCFQSCCVCYTQGAPLL